MNAPDLTGAVWKKSIRSGDNGGSCVEIAFVEEVVAVRDSKDKPGPALFFTPREWDAFLAGAKDGEFDLH